MYSGMTEYISTAEVAELTGYGETYIRRLVRQGELKADKKGNQYWVDRQSRCLLAPVPGPSPLRSDPSGTGFAPPPPSVCTLR